MWEADYPSKTTVPLKVAELCRRGQRLDLVRGGSTMTLQVSSNVYERWVVVSALFLITVFGFAVSPSPAWAQATAALNGTVRDSAGAVVTEATVVLHNRDTSLDRTAATNSVGTYVMPDVQPGNYDLKVTKAGFGPSIKSGITLVVNQTATYDFALKAGAVNAVVEVQANALELETSTAELGVAAEIGTAHV